MRSTRGYLIYILCIFVWTRTVRTQWFSGSWEIWHIALLVWIQAGSHPPSFTLTFDFEQIQKKAKHSADEPANFHMISTPNYKLCPLHKWKTVFKTIGFPNAINWSYFYVSEEDNPNSSDFSRMRCSNIQLIFTETLFTREVVLRVDKNIRIRA